MKVKVTYKKKGLNPFVKEFSQKTTKVVTVEVADNYNMALLRKQAIEEAPEGFEFIKLKKI